MRFASVLADTQHRPAILCASIGRVGSSLLYQSIIQARARSIFGSFTPSDTALLSHACWDLGRESIRPGYVVKTHDLPYHLVATTPMKVVFLFGRPSDTVLSVLRRVRDRGPTWHQRHWRHMHAMGDFADVIERDVMRLEEQIDAWPAVTGIPVLAINYEAIWAVQPILEDFLGFAVPLPTRRDRSFDDMDPLIVSRVRHAYARLDDKVAGMPLYLRSDCSWTGDPKSNIRGHVVAR